MRLFKEDVNWTPLNRDDKASNEHPIRADYLQKFGTSTPVSKVPDDEEDEEEDEVTPGCACCVKR
jgi:hypothetical protein